jgi:tetratricopeptide (TPR) repeat protein
LFAVIAAELKSGPGAAANDEQRAEKTLAFLHSRLLFGGYDLYATQLPCVLATGRYNCVSATVLYNCLAEAAGLDVRALRLPNHTCTELLDGERWVRVEATCADWIAARGQPRALANTNGESPFASQQVQSATHEAISDVALVAMIYYNRGVEALKRRDFEQAILLNRLALTLDSHNSSARGNLLAAINKQALKLSIRRQFAAALTLIDEGLGIDPDHEPLRQNRGYIDGLRTASGPP